MEDDSLKFSLNPISSTYCSSNTHNAYACDVLSSTQCAHVYSMCGTAMLMVIVSRISW